MLKFLDPILTSLNKLIGSSGIQSLLKASPFVVIPVILYLLGSDYLNKQAQETKESKQIRKIELGLELDPTLQRAVSSYLLAGDVRDSYFPIYLDIIQDMNQGDTLINLTTIGFATEFISQLKGFYQNGLSYELAKVYFSNPDILSNSKLLTYWLKESEKHPEDQGEKRVLDLLKELRISGPQAASYESIVKTYLEMKKVRKSTKKKVLPNQYDK